MDVALAHSSRKIFTLSLFLLAFSFVFAHSDVCLNSRMLVAATQWFLVVPNLHTKRYFKIYFCTTHWLKTCSPVTVLLASNLDLLKSGPPAVTGLLASDLDLLKFGLSVTGLLASDIDLLKSGLPVHIKIWSFSYWIISIRFKLTKKALLTSLKIN